MALVGAAVVEVLNQLPSNGLAREVAVRAARRRRSLMVVEWRRTVEGGGVGEEVTSGHPHDPPPQVGGRTLRASNWAGGRWLPLATPGLLHSGRCGGGGGWWREVGWLEKGGHHHDPRDDPPGLDFKKNSPPPPNVHKYLF